MPACFRALLSQALCLPRVIGSGVAALDSGDSERKARVCALFVRRLLQKITTLCPTVVWEWGSVVAACGRGLSSLLGALVLTGGLVLWADASLAA